MKRKRASRSRTLSARGTRLPAPGYRQALLRLVICRTFACWPPRSPALPATWPTAARSPRRPCVPLTGWQAHQLAGCGWKSPTGTSAQGWHGTTPASPGSWPARSPRSWQESTPGGCANAPVKNARCCFTTSAAQEHSAGMPTIPADGWNGSTAGGRARPGHAQNLPAAEAHQHLTSISPEPPQRRTRAAPAPHRCPAVFRGHPGHR